MTIEMLCIKHSSWHPLQHYRAVALPGNPNPDQYTPMNVNSLDLVTFLNVDNPGIDRTPANVNSLSVDGTPVKANEPNIDESQND